MDYLHKPVLLDETIESFSYLKKRDGAIFVDGTLGLAGHSIAIAEALRQSGREYQIIGIDKDSKALSVAKSKISKNSLENKFTLFHEDFNHFGKILDDMGIKSVDGILLDLGVSSMQLDDKTRGFSFTDPNQPLDMRMDRSQKINASNIINQYSPKELERVFKAGEEWHFRKIAKAIVEYRKSNEIHTVGGLVEILRNTLPKIYGKTHFATDAFRALRIEVNCEISNLSQTIDNMVQSLTSGGRLAIITFHSLEDRIVKEKFSELASSCTCPPQFPKCICGKRSEVKIITKKPLEASQQELADNSRSRSAKLRVVEKI